MKLKAIVQCNGSNKQYNGVSACEAKRMLKQKIVFNEEVIMTSDCIENKTLFGKSFELVPNKDECLYIAETKKGLKHKHTLLAFDKIRLVK